MSRNPTVRYAVPGTTIAGRAYGFNRIAVSVWHQCYSKFMARFTADQVLNADETSMRLNETYTWVSLRTKWVAPSPC